MIYKIFKPLHLILLLFLVNISFAQQQQPCTAPECSQFDFWIGEWNLTWQNENGDTLHGFNSIKKILAGCVIEENFNGLQASPLIGKSVSVLNNATKKWKQTWVDNQGGYLDFVGEFKDGKMILNRTAEQKGKKFLQRMVWYNISESQLDWNWERSDDNGKTWQTNWQIHYERK